MRFAIYGRKSVYSDKSDSIDNQIRMCKDFIRGRFSKEDIGDIMVYSDEDFSGATADRPDLTRLLSDIKEGNIDALVVYQLDRLSRDVRDFSNIYALLESKGVVFASIKESIDTTTPIGKAMMYVTVVFAQMERETTAARVTDNLIGLAKKGYWPGGSAPLGYERKNITVDGRHHVTLSIVQEDADYVLKFFNAFLDNRCSLTAMETSMRKSGMRTKSGAFFSSAQIHKILTSPFGCQAKPDVYDYFAAKGCIMEDAKTLWDGSHGVMVYGRTSERSGHHRLAPPSNWHVCIGKHEPFIPAEKWLAVQSRLGQNRFDKTTKYDPPLLKGILRCSCGSSCGVARKKKKDGSVSSWYYCRRHTREGAAACPDSHQIKCEILDDKVIEVFKEIAVDQKEIMKYVKCSEPRISNDNSKTLRSRITNSETRIRRLMSSLAESDDTAGAPYIREEIDRLALEVQSLKRELSLADAESQRAAEAEQGAEARANEIAELIKNLDEFTPAEKNEIARACIQECVWDGHELFLRL